MIQEAEYSASWFAFTDLSYSGGKLRPVSPDFYLCGGRAWITRMPGWCSMARA